MEGPVEGAEPRFTQTVSGVGSQLPGTGACLRRRITDARADLREDLAAAAVVEADVLRRQLQSVSSHLAHCRLLRRVGGVCSHRGEVVRR